MRCENKFCVYYRKGSCLLTEITLNEIGLCKDFVSIDFNDEELNAPREKVRKLMEKKYGMNKIFDNIRNRQIQEILRKKKKEKEQLQ